MRIHAVVSLDFSHVLVAHLVDHRVPERFVPVELVDTHHDALTEKLSAYHTPVVFRDERLPIIIINLAYDRLQLPLEEQDVVASVHSLHDFR